MSSSINPSRVFPFYPPNESALHFDPSLYQLRVALAQTTT